MEFAGAGGNVKLYRPTVSYPVLPVLKKRTIVGFG
jgi:hypothetical protein